jgi:hypothetical protein
MTDPRLQPYQQLTDKLKNISENGWLMSTNAVSYKNK